jgi:hypothetical protein
MLYNVHEIETCHDHHLFHDKEVQNGSPEKLNNWRTISRYGF